MEIIKSVTSGFFKYTIIYVIDIKIYYGICMKDYSVPIPVVRSLKFLGQNLRQARIKRRLTMALVEERASITHVTLTKIEKGEVTVSMANYAKVMFVLGFIDELSKIADPFKDDWGRVYDDKTLPKRVRYSTKKE